MASAREKIEEEVTCPVCMERFQNSGIKSPRILPCHHTICESCLQGIVSSDMTHLYTLKCPTCRNEAIIPNGQVQNFEIDFRVNRLIEILSRLAAKSDTMSFEEEVSKKAADLRPEVTKSANSVRSFLRQLELALRQNEVNSTRCKKKVAENMKLCIALMKQKENEMLEEIESRRRENEQALILQQEEASLELGNIESVLALEQNCFINSARVETARQTEAEVIPLMEVYSIRHHNPHQPVIPEPIHPFTQEIGVIARVLTSRFSDIGNYTDDNVPVISVLESSSDSSLDDSGISETPPRVQDTPPRNRRHNATNGIQNDNQIDSWTTNLEASRRLTSIRERPLSNSLRYFSTTWGCKGNRRGQLDTPTGLSVINDNQLAIADAGNCRVCVYNLNGTFVRTFGKKGYRMGQLNCPNSVASFRDRIFVADTYNHRIVIHKLDGGFISSFGGKGTGAGEFDRPIGVTVTTEGKVLVADTWNHRIQEFDLNGNVIKSIGQRGSGPGEFQCPCSIAINSLGNIYICDLDNKRIQVLTPSGVFLRQFGLSGDHEGAINAPRAIAIDANDYVYITEYENHHFMVFDSEDKFVSRYGSWGRGAGEFDKPCGIAVDVGGRVFVSDSFNHRIHVF